MKENLQWMTGHTAAVAIANRQLSPVELMNALILRISELDKTLHTFVNVDYEAAIASAKLAESEIFSGNTKGALHGVPVAIKDVIDVAGLPTTCCSKILAANLAVHDAKCVADLRTAGAIILGKVTTYEFAVGGPSFDLPWPPARNPWNIGVLTGGSSSGSAAGLAAGLFPLALGTDTGGSIRSPAGFCGIVGLKPTYGSVSRQGVFPLSSSLDHVGPMARDVTDCALMFSIVERQFPEGRHGQHFSRGNFLGEIEDGIKGLRVGVIRNFHEDDFVAPSHVTEAFDRVSKALESEGATIVDVQLPPLQEFQKIYRAIMLWESWSVHSHWLSDRLEEYGQRSRKRLLPGRFVTEEEYEHALGRRREMYACVEEAFRDVDVLLCANSIQQPCKIDDPETIDQIQAQQAQLPFNVTGHPAICLMIGLDDEGLPLSAQFVTRYFGEAILFRVARAWERLSGVDQLRAPCLLT